MGLFLSCFQLHGENNGLQQSAVCILYWPSFKYQILPSEKFPVSLKFKISLAQFQRRISHVPHLIPILVD